MKNKLFIPMYIDKVKLFDLNSIICGGFSEFNEITISTDNNSTTELKSNMGFNLFKIKGNIDGNKTEDKNNKITGNSKYIQTSASMLSNILEELQNDKIKRNIEDCKIGDFVDLNLNFNLNSILEILKKMKILINFGNQAIKFDKNTKNPINLNNEIKMLESLINMLGNDSDVVELVSETAKYIYVIYLKKEYLYHTQLERIDGLNLNYLAQVIDITDNYNFCNDTVLSEISGDYIKQFIESVRELTKQDIFSKHLNLVTDASNKKIVLLDVISITRKMVENDMSL